MKAASQLPTKKIFRVRFSSGSRASASASSGCVSAACSGALNGPSAASIQLSGSALSSTNALNRLRLAAASAAPAAKA